VLACGGAAPAGRARAYLPELGRVVSPRLKSRVEDKINLHTPVIEYTYVVDGKPYRNDAFTAGDDEMREDLARSILERYPVGAPCTVYYDPADPRISALSIHPTSRVVTLMIVTLCLGTMQLLAGVRFLCNPVRMTRRMLLQARQKVRRVKRHV
jgi:hypothetical protein